VDDLRKILIGRFARFVLEESPASRGFFVRATVARMGAGSIATI
jgi:hypothetical protein